MNSWITCLSCQNVNDPCSKGIVQLDSARDEFSLSGWSGGQNITSICRLQIDRKNHKQKFNKTISKPAHKSHLYYAWEYFGTVKLFEIKIIWSWFVGVLVLCANKIWISETQINDGPPGSINPLHPPLCRVTRLSHRYSLVWTVLKVTQNLLNSFKR